MVFVYSSAVDQNAKVHSKVLLTETLKVIQQKTIHLPKYPIQTELIKPK